MDKPTKEDLVLQATTVANEADADVIFYAGPMEYPGDFRLIAETQKNCCRSNAIVMVTTGGGSADSAYRVMRCLQRRYHKGRIEVFIDTFCKSAGTLLAVGADQLVMAETAEIGPLDVQVLKPDEVGERTSGLTPMQAMQALRDEAFSDWEEHFLSLRKKSGFQITSKLAADIAVRLTTGWFQPLYEQIDPMRLGENARAMAIAMHYGRRLAVRRNVKEGALHRLLNDYPSHGFVIDADEARQLFHNVRMPTAAEESLASILSSLGYIETGLSADEPLCFYLSPSVDKATKGEATNAKSESTQSATQSDHGNQPDTSKGDGHSARRRGTKGPAAPNVGGEQMPNSEHADVAPPITADQPVLVTPKHGR